MASAAKTLENLKSRFNSQAAAGHKYIFQFDITDDANYVMSIANRQLDLHEGVHSNPDITLTMNSQTFADLIEGEIEGMTAFSFGELQVTGNIVLAPKLKELFPKP